MIKYEVEVYANGGKWWYLKGKLHREDGPASEYADGTKCWYLNDKLHREDGPAIEGANGSKEWYLKGKVLTEAEHKAKTNPTVEMTMEEICEALGKNEMIKYEAIVYADGGKEWFLDGKRHREDGPAIEYADGSKLWYLKGKYHREGGPAVEYANGDKWWYLNGKLHREDGPAIEYADGNRFWYLNDDKLTEEAYKKATTKATCAGKEVEIDGVTYVLKLKGQDNE